MCSYPLKSNLEHLSPALNSTHSRKEIISAPPKGLVVSQDEWGGGDGPGEFPVGRQSTGNHRSTIKIGSLVSWGASPSCGHWPSKVL